MPFIRSISGIRATVNDSLDSRIIQRYIIGFSQYLPAGSIVVGYDGRTSGSWISEIVTHTLTECGRDVIFIGIAPTPTVQLLTEHTKECVGGISISASHNPSEWNGLKFIGGDGVFLDAEQNHSFWQCVDNGEELEKSDKSGSLFFESEAMKIHIRSIVDHPLFTEIFTKNSKKTLSVVVDAVNASGSEYVPALLRTLGCHVIELYCDKSGIFPHTPEPLPEHLQELRKAVIAHKADLGIAVDPDADRLVLIDENGQAIGEERTITLAVLAALSLRSDTESQENVVVNLSTTMAVRTICDRLNATLHRTPVGEINVVRQMQATGAIIGGEGSGGVIFPASHFGRDSLVGTALLLSLMQKTNLSLSELNNSVPTFTMKKTKVEFSGDFSTIKKRLASLFTPITLREDDGFYCEFNDGWLHVRTSNTEPIARIIAESSNEITTDSLIQKALQAFV